MSDIIQKGSAIWHGEIKSGHGHVSTASGALNDQPYGFNTRFEGQPGTNPEELIAAAHASCFSMALSKILGEAGHPADEIRTTASVTLAKNDSGFKVTKIHLDLTAKVPGMEAAAFAEAAGKAKDNCPISKLLKPGLDELTMNAKLA